MASYCQNLSEKTTSKVYAAHLEEAESDVRGRRSNTSESSDIESNFITHEIEGPSTSYDIEFDEHSKSYYANIKQSNTTRILYVMGAIIRFFIPSFIQRTSRAKKAVKLHPTAYLDGLRGVAALIVCIDHFILDRFPRTRFGWGSAPDGSNNWFMMLPMVRIIFAGRSMVAVFFVVSGYALSYKPLKLRNDHSFDTLLSNLSSSTFRRPFRLYLPVLVANLISQTCSYMGWFSIDMPGSPGHLDGFWAHAAAWWRSLTEMLDPTHPDPYVGYNKQLWTIPIEFRGSILIFLTLLGLVKMRSRIRMTVEVIMVSWFLYSGHWDLFLFLSGVLLADIRLAREQAKLKNPIQLAPMFESSSQSNKILKFLNLKFSKVLWVLPFLIGIYLACQALNFSQTPGYMTLASFVPVLYKANGQASTFWQSIGAVILVISIDNAIFLQNIFTTKFAQYLGKISFAIYIIHVPVLFSIRDPLLKFVWGLTGQDTTTSYAIGFALASTALTPLVFWIADIFWRAIDEPSVKAAKWLADRCTLVE